VNAVASGTEGKPPSAGQGAAYRPCLRVTGRRDNDRRLRDAGFTGAYRGKGEKVGVQSSSGPSGGQKSTGTAVKEQGSQTAQQAGQAGRHVTQKATEQGKHVVAEAGRQAHGMLDQAQSQLMEQAGAQKQRAASGLRGLGGQLRSAAEGAQPGPTKDLIGQASGRIDQIADWLEHREPGQVIEELRDFARQRPGAFLGGAVLAGMLVGRLTRSITAGGGQMGDDQMGAAPSPDGGSPDASMPLPEGARG
jgi:hypothetical protein